MRPGRRQRNIERALVDVGAVKAVAPVPRFHARTVVPKRVNRADKVGAAGTLVAEGVDVDSDAFTKDDVDNLSGKIVYIENRAPVTRAANQQEDIKVVISL